MRKNIILKVICILAISEQLAEGHLLNIFKSSTWRKISCRARHRRVVLDKNGKFIACMKTCPVGFIEKYTAGYGHHCKPENFPLGCTDIYCSGCKPSYLKLSSYLESKCVKKCPSGYRESIVTQMCIECSVRNCKTCNFLFGCSKCKSGFKKSLKFGEDKCVKVCRKGYEAIVNFKGDESCIKKPKTTTTPPTQPEKVERIIRNHLVIIPKGCTDHTCVTCIDGYFRFIQQTGGNVCLPKCPSGYTELATMCVPCADRQCHTCKRSIGECDKCFPGYSMLHGPMNRTMECVRYCPRTHFKKVVNGVELCRRNSEKENIPKGCTDHTCITCINGYFRFIQQTGGNVCLSKCPSSYTEFSTMCVPCADRQCDSCKNSIGQCDKCLPGYSMLYGVTNSTMQCVRYCPNTHEKKMVNSVEMCVKLSKECPVENCKTCVSDKLHGLHKGCEMCEQGFVLFRSTFNDFCYKKCPQQYFSAVDKKSNVTYCEKCKQPFCKICDQAACQECIEPMVVDSETGKCKVCGGMTVYSFQWKQCVLTAVNKHEALTDSEIDVGSL